jgi:hypothetical protein
MESSSTFRDPTSPLPLLHVAKLVVATVPVLQQLVAATHVLDVVDKVFSWIIHVATLVVATCHVATVFCCNTCWRYLLKCSWAHAKARP